MLTDREKRFMEYWKKSRDKEKKVFHQLLFGLPLGLLFVIPIILNFSAGWYKRADMWARSHNDDNTGVVLLIAALIIIVFIAIFSKRHRWEMNEQTYRELELKQTRENETVDAAENI